MRFSEQDKSAIRAAVIAHAHDAVGNRKEYPRLDRILGDLERAVIKGARKRGEDEKKAAKRVKGATRKHLASDGDAGEQANEVLFAVGRRAVLGKVEGRGRGGGEDTPVIELTHPLPQFGSWTFQQRLLRVECKTETSSAPGDDEMMYVGTYNYVGPGLLTPYAHDFDAGDSHNPDKVLAQVPVQLGAHDYRAEHRVTEEDVFSAGTAQMVAMGITLLLDLLIELGIQLGRAALRAWLMGQRPDGVSVDDWAKAVDEMLDGAEEAAQEASDDLLGILAEWLAEALGPEVFPTMTSHATITWSPPAPPVVSNIRVVGSGQEWGRPRVITGYGTSVVMAVPLRRSGGGEYIHYFAFDLFGYYG